MAHGSSMPVLGPKDGLRGRIYVDYRIYVD